MNRKVLVVAFMLTTSVQAGNQSNIEKKEIVKEHKALSGLKAVTAAVGAGSALYLSYLFLSDAANGVKGFVASPSKKTLTDAHIAAGLVALLGYSAYKLGYEALPDYVHRVLAK